MNPGCLTAALSLTAITLALHSGSLCWTFPPSLRSVGNAAVSGDCLMPSLRSGREPGSQDGLALRAAAYRRIIWKKNKKKENCHGYFLHKMYN